MKNTKQGSMRDKMPETAKFLDELREVFGAEPINRVIKGQVHGGEDLGFWASEAGHTVGKRKNDGVGVSPVVDWSSRQAWEKKKSGAASLPTMVRRKLSCRKIGGMD